ncbi:hypothetical protein N0V82_008843 [Gnomoniopsis sp. IMI 355080]|nr:hypothetical protein N0V82_008843 [Gnomoniopsis sp. IMI 355080]
MAKMIDSIFTMLSFLLTAILVPNLVCADDVNDILMLNNQECNNYGDQMQCTGVVADYCCFATMPFCWVTLYDSAEVRASLTAWSNTNSCPVGSGAPSQTCTSGYCSCLDANTAGSDTAACSSLWSQRVIKNITHDNFEEVMGFYNGQNYNELAKLAVPVED